MCAVAITLFSPVFFRVFFLGGGEGDFEGFNLAAIATQTKQTNKQTNEGVSKETPPRLRLDLDQCKTPFMLPSFVNYRRIIMRFLHRIVFYANGHTNEKKRLPW